MDQFYSNGKLLATGEYLILDGAIGLGLPTKFGQSLLVKQNQEGILHWKSYDFDKTIWFETQFYKEELHSKIIENEDSTIRRALLEILRNALSMLSIPLEYLGFHIETHLTFPRNWGLGTSSTLINNIAQWLQIDAFELLQKSFGGSGYDIACAQINQPILFQLENNIPNVKKVYFSPDFHENIHFLYLNKKQNSRDAITNYLSKQQQAFQYIPKVNALTHEALQCKTGKEFALVMEKHEVLLSEILESQTVKELHFPDFKGVIKSLGAWGGDFVMIISKDNPKDYFKEKGFETLIAYQQMIL